MPTDKNENRPADRAAAEHTDAPRPDTPHRQDTPEATQGVNREPARPEAPRQQHPMAPRDSDLPEPDDVRAASAEAEDLQHTQEQRPDPVHPGPHQDRREGQSGESGRY